DGLTVAFPGTNNVACWLADLDVALTTVRGMGRVHAGFWGAYASIEGPLMDQSPEVTCGHSEGAALALLYGGALCLAGKPPKAVYAFEPPRVSIDGVLAKLFQRCGVQLLLTQNGEDVVPQIPRLLHTWQHPGELTRIGKAYEPFPNVEDHLIEHVIEALSG
ncbi:MAG: lipase, partial [Betaproteobacteria bacterium]|nr:lipase [Betaproteobacteria bacterium]